MPTAIERPRIVDKNDPRYFSLRTHAVRAIKSVTKAADGSEVTGYLIEGTASSSVEDRYGDTLTEVCQADMLAQADGLTMWLNHSYNVPEDIAGTCINPTLERATADDGTSCLDLKITLEIDAENPRAYKAWQHVNAGTRLAFSIGGYFTDADLVFDDEDDWWGHFIVNAVDLLEISLVGIPANPRAYTKTFESLRAAVVKRAEEIARDARVQSIGDRRVAMRKSFGLSAKEVQTVKKCTQQLLKDGAPVSGCDLEEGHAGAHSYDPAPVTEVPDEQCAVVLDFPASMTKEQRTAFLAELKALWQTAGAGDFIVLERKAVEDEGQQSRIVECMKCIKNAINCAGHSMCAEPETHARTAHAILKAMLPDDYGLPEDAQLAATLTPGEPPRLDAFTITLDVDGEPAKKTIAEVQALVASLSADLQRVTQEFETLKATPTGRFTRSTASNPSGRSEGSESTVPASAYYKN